MKKSIIFNLSLAVIGITAMLGSIMSSCTDNARARQWGGNQTINLPKGQRLLNVTWKQTDLWYLTEAMPADYVPGNKVFVENSSAGLFEGTVTFIETK